MRVASSLHVLRTRAPGAEAWMLLALLVSVVLLLAIVALLGVTTHDPSPATDVRQLAPFRWTVEQALA
jgi:hypothetical protein